MKRRPPKPIRRYLLIIDEHTGGGVEVRGPFKSNGARINAANQYPQYAGALFELDVPLPADPRDARPRVYPLTGDEEGWSRG